MKTISKLNNNNKNNYNYNYVCCQQIIDEKYVK